MLYNHYQIKEYQTLVRLRDAAEETLNLSSFSEGLRNTEQYVHKSYEVFYKRRRLGIPT